MKKIVLLIFLITTVSFGKAPVEKLIFDLQDKHTHGSSIVECPNGDLLACWFHGSGERTANDVVVNGARLKKGETEWSDMFLMADTPNLPDCNPVLFIDKDEKLWLFWIAVQAEGWQYSILKYRYTTDYMKDGAPNWQWQDIMLLQPGEAFADKLEENFKALNRDEGMWAEYALPYTELLIQAAKEPAKRQTGWMTRIHPLVLPTGRILLPLYSDGFNTCLIAISDDMGETWRASLPIVGYAPEQPSIVRKKDGTLVVYLRDAGDAPNRVLISTSKDDGETWSPAVDTDIPNSGSSLEVISLKDGRWVNLFNDVEHGRHSLALAMSDDEGATWKWKRHIEYQADGHAEFSYPSIIQGKDGKLHMTYSYKVKAGRAIKYLSVEPDWIMEK